MTSKIKIAIFALKKDENLDLCLQSLSQQTLPEDQYVVQVYECETGLDRETVLLESSEDFVLFLDADCRLPTNYFLQNCQNWMQSQKDWVAVGGLYLNSLPSGYVAKAYNFICNLWVLCSKNTRNACENLLGGTLFINNQKIKNKLVQNPILWAGEDTFLLRQLIKIAPLYVDPKLSVVHENNSDISYFINRAFRHGQSQKKYHLKTPHFYFSLQLWDFLMENLKYWPLLALHLSCVELGKINQWFAPQRMRSLWKLKKQGMEKSI